VERELGEIKGVGLRRFGAGSVLCFSTPCDEGTSQGWGIGRPTTLPPSLAREGVALLRLDGCGIALWRAFVLGSCNARRRMRSSDSIDK
jgi:hypothetical protein